MTNNASISKLLYVLTIGTALTAGCAQMEEFQADITESFGGSEEESDLTPAQRELRERSKTRNTTIVQGALAGAAIGAGIQLARGETDPKDIAIASAGGAVAGSLAAAYVASRNEAAADEKEQLESLILSVRGNNEQMSRDIDTLRQVVADGKSKLRSLQKQLDEELITQEQYRQQIASIEESKRNSIIVLNDSEQQLADFRRTQQLYQQDNPGVNTDSLNQEINKFENLLDSYRNLSSELTEIG